MSQLYAVLKAAYLQAMKDRSPTKTALGTVVGEVGTKAKNENRDIEDKDVVKVISNTIAGLNAMVDAGVKTNNQTVVEESKAEIALLSKFLPAAKPQLSDSELSSAIKAIIDSGSTKMGDVMSALKAKHEGQYDPKAASVIVKASLA